MLELLLIRHGQTEWNSLRKVMGRRPIPLNEAGRAQAESVSMYLETASLSAVISSPVERALETAKIIASRQNGISVQKDESFVEIDYGEWAKYGFDDLPVRFDDEWNRYRNRPMECRFPGGESMKDAAARINDGVDRIIARYPDERVAIVSHADVLKIALVRVLGLDPASMIKFAIDNCAVLLVRFVQEGGPRLVLVNQLNGFGKDMRISDAVIAASRAK